MIYVLGRGEGTLTSAKSLESFHNFSAPGWISLVHYDREAVQDAAPMHGLGYYNLPQDLKPKTMVLASNHLYVSVEGAHFPYIDTPYEVDLDGKITLLGYDLDSEPVEPGSSIHVTLYWQAQQTMVVSYKVFVHLYDGDGNLVAQRDSLPGLGAKPTTTWEAGEVVADRHGGKIQRLAELVNRRLFSLL